MQFNKYKKYLSVKIITVMAIIVCAFSLNAQTVTLSADSEVVSAGEVFRFILSAEGSFESIIEPEFNGFDIENRSESQSSSISIINGKMESKKSINYVYHLRAKKNGVFKIGPASLKLKNGKRSDSNVVSITVTGNVTDPYAGNNNAADKTQNNDSNNKSPTLNSLLAPLTTWEKKTAGYFVRAVVSPSEKVFEGEPLIVKYYLFTKPGAISDLNFYKLPSFEKCWKEERNETRLTFKRAAIDGEVYDYGLLKTYLLIPEKGLSEVTGTQMIVDVMTGSFFNTRKQSVSTPALRIPLEPLPEKNLYPQGIFGKMTVNVDKSSVTLDKNNILEAVTYNVTGCGDFQSVEIKTGEVQGLKIFSPEIELNAKDTSDGYCGNKKYKFMVKGTKKGNVSIKPGIFYTFNRKDGWSSVNIPEVSVNIKDISISHDSEENVPEYSFELLKELPNGIKKYEISPLIKRSRFQILFLLPFLIVLISFFTWLFRNLSEIHSKSNKTKIEKWKNNFKNAASLNELLNSFYDGMKDVYSIEIKGERKIALSRKYGDSIENILVFIKNLEHASYSNDTSGNLAEFKLRAIEFLNLREKRK